MNTAPKKPGRPRLYKNQAEKQWVYRQRRKALLPPTDAELAGKLRTVLRDAINRGDNTVPQESQIPETDVLARFIIALENRDAWKQDLFSISN